MGSQVLQKVSVVISSLTNNICTLHLWAIDAIPTRLDYVRPSIDSIVCNPETTSITVTFCFRTNMYCGLTRTIFLDHVSDLLCFLSFGQNPIKRA